MNQLGLPDNVRNLSLNETFCFRCHRDVACFTDCCRELDLALTPYDVIRLRQALNISSKDFFCQHAIVEQGPEDAFPHVYLAMVDDGRASCPFVSEKGCRVYRDRPGACRTYPVGRAAFLDEHGKPAAYHVLLTEPHCRGFHECSLFSVEQWIGDQGLAPYNTMNDAVMFIMQHPAMKQGKKIIGPKADKFLLSLYHLDEFHVLLQQNQTETNTYWQTKTTGDTLSEDTVLLKYAIQWLYYELFGEKLPSL